MYTVDEIIEMCGGKREVAYRLGKLHSITVSRWSRIGIPVDRWEGLIALAREQGRVLTAEQIYQANKAAGVITNTAS